MSVRVNTALSSQWRASDLERYSPSAAQAFRDAADVLEKTLQGAEDTVSLKEAVMLGGYSAAALQRMVAAERIQNFGRKGKPRIRRADVPLKPGHAAGDLLAESGRSYVDPTAVVASVKARGKNP
jgi:hypothetical protein